MICPECNHIHQGKLKCEFPIWTTLPKLALSGNLPCQCKIQGEIKWGFKFNLTSLWVGVHYSKRERRTCVNLIPCFTFWITRRGGTAP